MVAVSEEAYPPIEAYGLIGNRRTCALVGPDGGIDWFPYPHLESPSIFAAILDTDRGGRFRISPIGAYESSQRYRDRTNVLETTFRTADGTATVTDLLPPMELDHLAKVIYRRVACTGGAVDLEIEFEPRFDYGRVDPTMSSTDRGVLATGEDVRTVLESPVSLDIGEGRATGGLALEDGDEAWVLLRCSGAEDADADPEGALADTAAYWDDWVHDCETTDECVFDGAWHDLVVRSELLLKLLTHAESGATAAAPTTSLPEDIGGVRNWDYRYNWLRDAGFTVQALANLGHVDAAESYFDWFIGLYQADTPSELQPLYGLHGDADLEEEELDHLAGYRDSRPVRVGNGAADQRQLDVYGELLLAVDEMLQYDRRLSADEWGTVRGIVEYVREVWTEPDAGIWEVRDGPKQFVYSKVMCWVALDRGIDIATTDGYEAPLDAWRETRDDIRETVLDRGYDDDIGAFVQSYDGSTLDATALLLPVVGFLPFEDDRFRGTIDAVEDRLASDDVFVRRYDGSDGLPGEEGAFVMCSCWLVDALVLSGRVAEGRDRFENLLEYVNDLDLLAEELDPDTGRYLGNYPQAFSHIGLVNSALYLGYAAGRDLLAAPPMGIRLGDPPLSRAD